MTGDEKIAIMHREYGTMPGAKCKTCPHLDAYCNADCTRVWYKCHMFGVSNGPGTDWRVGNDACGAFTLDPDDAKSKHLYGDVYRRISGLRPRGPAPQVEGQLEMII